MLYVLSMPSLTPPPNALPQRAELTAEERQELTEAFGMFDAEQTGRIDLHELKVLMRALGFQVRIIHAYLIYL